MKLTMWIDGGIDRGLQLKVWVMQLKVCGGEGIDREGKPGVCKGEQTVWVMQRTDGTAEACSFAAWIIQRS